MREKGRRKKNAGRSKRMSKGIRYTNLYNKLPELSKELTVSQLAERFGVCNSVVIHAAKKLGLTLIRMRGIRKESKKERSDEHSISVE